MSISFYQICSLLESVEVISKRRPRLSSEKKQEDIRRTISNWFHNHRNALDNPDTNGGAVLSALFPHRRKDRVYGLQAPSLSTKLIKLLQFNCGRLTLFQGWRTGTQGDLGVYAELAMRKWNNTYKTKPIIPIERIDWLLVQLAAKSRSSDDRIRQRRDWQMDTDRELRDVFVQLDSWEAKWLVRLILRDYCTIELDEEFVFNCYHFLLPDLLKFQNDFEVVFGMLRGELARFPPVPDPESESLMRKEAALLLEAVVGVKVGRPTFHKAWSFNNCLQLVGNCAWAAEVKYDGEYCEIHVDLENAPNDIKIFSKNGKDATADRQPLHVNIRNALRIGHPDCQFKRRCIVLGEMVLWSEKEQKILPFSKIRKHILRSGTFLGTLQDSPPHEWEHLMIVFFDVLRLDEEPVLRYYLQDRRKILRNLVQVIPGRSMRSEWTLVDFKTEFGMSDLKESFARTLAYRQEGLVLKPLHSPYFSLVTERGHRLPGYFIKVKKDYLGDMGGERDLGDFAIIGASFNPQIALRGDLKPIHWTHFYLGCLLNKIKVQRHRAKPRFKVVGSVSVDKCIPKVDAKYLNVQGYVRQAPLQIDGSINEFDIEHSKGYDPRMSVAFKKPFVVEILGGGFEQLQNETFEMLRHPRITKVHYDRTWEDATTMEDLKQIAGEKWDVPNAGNLQGHAKEVALLVKKYRRDMGECQMSNSEHETTQETTQCTTMRTTSEHIQSPASNAVVQESDNTWTTISSTQCSSSTQDTGIRASREARILVREDTSERVASSSNAQPPQMAPSPPSMPHKASSSKKRTYTDMVSPPSTKRRKARGPLIGLEGNGY